VLEGSRGAMLEGPRRADWLTQQSAGCKNLPDWEVKRKSQILEIVLRKVVI
jgi:hypothetical protein